MITAEQIIEHYDMKPLPYEGGFYVETHRSEEMVKKNALPDRYASDRNFCTEILYLLTSDTYSKLHRVKSDEIFHFYLGDPVKMLNIFADGTNRVVNIGTDILSGQQPQVIVPKGTWQGAFIEPPGKFALMGCTVAPGFEFEDFQLADRGQVLEKYPDQQHLVEKLI